LSNGAVAETNLIDPIASGEHTENQTSGATAEEALLRLASAARFFRSVDGCCHARVSIGSRNEILALDGATFRSWLVDGYLKAYGKLPSHRAVSRVLEALEARARFETATGSPAVYVRVGCHCHPEDNGSSYYLDLGDPSGQAVKIGASGWSVVDRPAVHFRRPQGLLSLPLPSRDGSIELLRPFVNLSEADFGLLVAWMAAAHRPAGPYPVLVIHGEQGSAKSTLTKIIRKLIDPRAAPLLAEPGSTRDLMVTAQNGWLLAFDNLSALPNRLSDSLCRLATGGAFAARMLFSNHETHIIHAERPVILNGIDEFVHRADLVDRSLFLDLPSITPTSRRPEDEFWASFAEVYPRLLGALLDAVAGALRELPSVKLLELPRMADFARFGEAVGRGLGWPPGTFISAYNDNRRASSAAALEDSVVAATLLELASSGKAPSQAKSPTDLLSFLTDMADRKAISSARWPKTPSMLSNELRRLAPQLRARGMSVAFSKTHKSRMITISIRAGSDYSAAAV
jgi:hypothetical protein